MILPNKTYIQNEDLPWVVLINGLFADLTSWNDSIELLNEYNVLTYNGRGQGEAPVLDHAYDLDEQVEDLYQLIQSKNLKKIALIGLSNGGRVALKFASQYPELVWALVPCDTYGNVSTLLKLKLESWLKAHHEGGATLRFDVATPWVWGESLIDKNPELVSHYRELSKKSNENNIINLIKGALTGEVNLKKIKAPTLLIVGDEDLLTPVTQHIKLKNEITNSVLSVVRGGHASLLENPNIITKDIIPFLRSQNELV